MAKKVRKSSVIYEEYINSNKSIKELAEKYELKYQTICNMLHEERQIRGNAVRRRR